MKALVIDFGAEKLELLTAALEKFNIDYFVVRHGFSIDDVDLSDLGAIILSGSVHCSFLPGAPDLDKRIYDLGVPVLGICYGMQITSIKFGGRVEKSPTPEFGATDVQFYDSKLFEGINKHAVVHMTHYDYVTKCPDGFTITAKTDKCPIAALENKSKNLYLVQFHPEFFIGNADTTIFKNFLFNICNFSN